MGAFTAGEVYARGTGTRIMRASTTGEKRARGTRTGRVRPLSAGCGFFHVTDCLLQSLRMHPQDGRFFGYERNRKRSR
jgi:hypothetical protein